VIKRQQRNEQTELPQGVGVDKKARAETECQAEAHAAESNTCQAGLVFKLRVRVHRPGHAGQPRKGVGVRVRVGV